LWSPAEVLGGIISLVGVVPAAYLQPQDIQSYQGLKSLLLLGQVEQVVHHKAIPAAMVIIRHLDLLLLLLVAAAEDGQASRLEILVVLGEVLR
jgi:hypothetical protein